TVRYLGTVNPCLIQNLLVRLGRTSRGIAFLLGLLLLGLLLLGRFFLGFLFLDLYLLGCFLGLGLGGIPLRFGGRGIYQADHGPHGHGIPDLGLQGNDATGLRGKFQGCLVRVHLGYGLVLLHIV